MGIPVFVVATDATIRDTLVQRITSDAFHVTPCAPDTLPTSLPDVFVLFLPGINTPEEQLIERLRADDTTAQTPIVIVSKLPMIELQSVPYASDWTIAIVEDPVDSHVLIDTMNFLLNPSE